MVDKAELNKELDKALSEGLGFKFARYLLSAIGGAIPCAGGLVSGISGAWSEYNADQINKIFASWIRLQEAEIKEIAKTMYEILVRLDLQNISTQERIESQEYLSLVKKSFRNWSAAESEEKRILIRNLLSNAASCSVTTDDVLRLFVDWIEKYSEIHFKVIREIYTNPGSTRLEIWQNIHGGRVRDDSAEADLFKLVIHELSTGYVIRQHRQVDSQGRFLRKTKHKQYGGSSLAVKNTMSSPFDDEKEYELTELGKQFVHYTMNEIVPRIGRTEDTVYSEMI